MAYTIPLFDLSDARDLSGVECRTLRAALNLERRHVVAMANAMGLADREVTMALLTNWERSKARGYPGPLARALTQLEEATMSMALSLVADQGKGVDAGVIRRPLGARRIHQLLSSNFVFRPHEVAALDAAGGDFFQVLADAATARACGILRDRGVAARVDLDRETDSVTGFPNDAEPTYRLRMAVPGDGYKPGSWVTYRLMDGEPYNICWCDGESRAWEAAREPGTHVAVVGTDRASLFAVEGRSPAAPVG